METQYGSLITDICVNNPKLAGQAPGWLGDAALHEMAMVATGITAGIGLVEKATAYPLIQGRIAIQSLDEKESNVDERDDAIAGALLRADQWLHF